MQASCSRPSFYTNITRLTRLVFISVLIVMFSVDCIVSLLSLSHPVRLTYVVESLSELMSV